MDTSRNKIVFERPGSDIRKRGYLKKLKTNKRKYFVLRSTSSSGPARLEYYDSEKKYNNGQLAKRSIQLHTLLNINKKSDSKHKYAIALYTKDDCFSIMAEDKAEQEEWYLLLLDFQCEYLHDGDNRREHFEHVWQVVIQQKGLAVEKHLRGSFRLCLSQNSLSLVKLNSDKPEVVFQLATVRSLAYNDNLFRMEVGSWAPTGAGELWMHVDDSVIAHNMHEAILNCMKAATDIASVDEPDARFDKRTESVSVSGGYRRTVSQDFRSRAVSESYSQSPRRLRSKPIDDQQRPVSTVYPTSRSTTISATDTVSLGTSPHMHLDLYSGPHRFRSDSTDSRASRSSMHAAAEDHSPMEFSPQMQSHSGSTFEQQDDSYMESDFSTHGFTSISSSPGESRTPLEEDAGQASPYIDMRPGNITPPTATSSGGYIPMNLGSQQATARDISAAAAESDSYMTMGPGRMASEPIPIKANSPAVGGGYMDMSHSSHLPTVREGGSNEGYLPMTPNSGQCSFDSSHLRPDPAVCMLSDDANEFPKRTYSLGSRPLAKPTPRIASIHDPVTIKHGVRDLDGRSSSAPHLITHRGLGLNVETPTPSASPLSMSYKSESSYRSDDSDSFMELDFHRPRTASDSHSYRPRASSFGKSAISALQGHRPRSSSYGQCVRTFKLKHGTRLGSYESVRTTSQELIHKTSVDSLNQRSSRDSLLGVSSDESLRKFSEELRTKTSLLNADYIDMSMDKRKTPSPQPPGRRENGYMDMTIGSRTTSPSRSKSSSHDSGNTSKSHSSEKLHVQGHGDETYINIETHDTTNTSSLSSELAYMTMEYTTNEHPHHGDHGDHGDHAGSRHSSHGRSDSRSSDKSVKTTAPPPPIEDSYVMYEPSVAKSGHPQDDGHRDGRTDPDSAESLKRKSKHAGMLEKVKVRESRHKHDQAGSGSKRKSHVEESKDAHMLHTHSGRKDSTHVSHSGRKESVHGKKDSVHVSHSSKKDSVHGKKDSVHVTQSVKKEVVASVPDEYIEFSPADSKTERRTTPVHIESEYVGFEPGSITSSPAICKPQQVKSYFSSQLQNAKEPSKSASGNSRVKPSHSGLASAKSGSDSENEYVLSSPVGGTAGPVLSSPIGTSTPTGVKVVRETSDYVVSSPARQVPKQDSEKRQTSLALRASQVAAATASSNKKVPQVSDSDYFNVDISKKTGRGHEGTSVDPPLASSSKGPSPPRSQEVAGQPSGSTVNTAVVKPKVQKKVEDAKSPVGSRHDGQGVRMKHYSGSASAGAATASSSVVKASGDSRSKQSRPIETGPRLEAPNTVALTRPGSTPCMLLLDDRVSKPASAAGSTTATTTSTTSSLSVDPHPRSRHSISDLSAYEQMTFPSNTLSSSQQQSSSSTLSSSQKPSSNNTLSAPQSPPQPQQQTASKTSSQQLGTAVDGEKVLNYASLDLGSSETVGEGDGSFRSPRMKSRHSSSASEKGEPPLSYAQIDFEKSELLKAAAAAAATSNKDVKFTL